MDSDCPLTASQYKEVLWERVRNVDANDLRGLLSSIQTDIGDVSWTPEIAATVYDTSTRASMKNALMWLFDMDDTFRASIESTIDTDAEFASARRSLTSGACRTGRCEVTAMPRTRIFDGSTDVAFSVADGTVMYTRNGVTRTVESVPCGDVADSVCDMAVPIQGTLLRPMDTVAATYRLTDPDTSNEFAVMNRLSVTDPSTCPKRICELNSDACPSTMCRLDDTKRCVPLEE